MQVNVFSRGDCFWGEGKDRRSQEDKWPFISGFWWPWLAQMKPRDRTERFSQYRFNKTKQHTPRIFPELLVFLVFGVLVCRHTANPSITSGTQTSGAHWWGDPYNPGAVALPQWTWSHTHTVAVLAQKGKQKSNRTKHALLRIFSLIFFFPRINSWSKCTHHTVTFFFPCRAATPIIPPSHWERIQVVSSNRVVRNRLAIEHSRNGFGVARIRVKATKSNTTKHTTRNT